MRSKRAKVTIIIPNWNLRAQTARCLESIRQSQHERQAIQVNTIVLDNGSQDGSAGYLREHFPGSEFPHVQVTGLPENRGFGRACNIAIRQVLSKTEAQFIFLLNNDASLHPQALEKLVETAHAYSQAGILGPKVYYRCPASKIWYAGARRRRAVLAAADTGRGESDQGQFEEITPVDYVFGAAIFIRRQVFERVGLFDERFFLYLEDLDFCLRAQQAGFDLLFAPQAKVWHTGSASTAGDLALHRYHLTRSTILFLHKHRSLVATVPAAFFWAAVFLRMLALDLARGRPRLALAYWSAFVVGAKHLRVR